MLYVRCLCNITIGHRNSLHTTLFALSYITLLHDIPQVPWRTLLINTEHGVFALLRDCALTLGIYRWRAEVVTPFVEASESHFAQLDRSLPPVHRAIEDLDGKLSKHLPELLGTAEAAEARQRANNDEVSRIAAVVGRIGEAHSTAMAQLEERVRGTLAF